MTAYFGLLKVGQPKAGDTVVVSAARFNGQAASPDVLFPNMASEVLLQTNDEEPGQVCVRGLARWEILCQGDSGIQVRCTRQLRGFF